MMHFNREILVLVKDACINEQAIEQEVQCLYELLERTESPELFCAIHELVNRNFITNAPQKILKESRQSRPKPFRFLINKN